MNYMKIKNSWMNQEINFFIICKSPLNTYHLFKKCTYAVVVSFIGFKIKMFLHRYLHFASSYS